VPFSGVENLEILTEARRYNAFLAALVARHARGAGRILDFGAGIGTFASALAAAGQRPLCLEPDAALAGRLAAQGFAVVHGLDEVEEASLDYVYTLNVLEHIADDAAALAGIRARLRPGGRLLIYVPAFAVLFSAMDRQVGHLRRYRRKALAALVEGAGFAVERAEYVDCLGFPAALAYRVFGGSGGVLNRDAVRLYDSLLFPASRALDGIFGRWFGKNLCLTAVRPATG
jgi:SAM-dependent methyltransferase